MKKIIVLISVFLSVFASILLLKLSYKTDALIKDNIDALSNGELIVGTLCAYCPGEMCIFYDAHKDIQYILDDAILMDSQ